jgi:tRNA(Ile2)-agmatinylcytidine synthase
MVDDISELKPYSSISVQVIVDSIPEYRDGGHLFFTVKDNGDHTAVCAAYEPTKEFRGKISSLVPGDRIRVWGSVRKEDVPDITINLEKIEIKDLVELYSDSNPRCPKCNGSTESMGKGQGLRCKKCSYRGEEMAPIREKVERSLKIGLIEPPQDAWRHLFKPSTIPTLKEKPYNGPWWGSGAP